MKNVRIKLNYLAYAGDMRSAGQIVRDLGLTYSLWVPQTLYDQIWLFNCDNLPDPFPPFISEITESPRSLIGYGLSAQDAEDVIRRAS
jgi:hypothetical protein